MNEQPEPVTVPMVTISADLLERSMLHEDNPRGPTIDEWESITTLIAEARGRRHVDETCPHIVTSGGGTAYCTLAESAGPAPVEDETLSQMLDRVAADITVGSTDGGWTENLARQAIVQHVASWYADHQTQEAAP